MKASLLLARALLVAGLVAAGVTAPGVAGAATTPYYGAAPGATSSGPDGIGVQVVNGRPATENYSFMVYVSGCTGSLIKANWAVTAKHCSTPASVRVGSVNRSSGGTVVSVTRAVNHPTSDVKLLQLASSVSHAPAPIPTTSGAVGTVTRIIGWGQTCPVRGCGSAPLVANELDTRSSPTAGAAASTPRWRSAPTTPTATRAPATATRAARRCAASAAGGT
jgi:hypothetical protein